jgi:hypothetical protein
LGEKLFFDYYNGYEINEVVLPERLEILHDYALAGNQLESVKLPKTLKTIGEYALAWNSHMSTIDIPFDAKIKENAFAFISPLTLRGYYNTGAEQFCKTYGGYTFEPLSDFEMAHTDGGFAVTANGETYVPTQNIACIKMRGLRLCGSRFFARFFLKLFTNRMIYVIIRTGTRSAVLCAVFVLSLYQRTEEAL